MSFQMPEYHEPDFKEAKFQNAPDVKVVGPRRMA